MNEVISSYIEDSHRTLLAKKGGAQSTPEQEDRGRNAAQKLPRLPQNGSQLSPQRTAQSTQNDANYMNSMVSQNVRSRAICSISDETHEDALREIDRLMKKNKSLTDELSIVTAKKMSFKAQALRDQKEMKKMATTLEALQKDAKSQKEDSTYKSEVSQQALTEISEMRETHIREVRMLQRGLQARTDETYRNRVNEIADLVDGLGRAALQRDQANKEKAKLQQRLRQTTVELKTLQEERKKYLMQNKTLASKLSDVQRTNKVLMQPRQDVFNLEEDELENESDDDFDSELTAFEKRYAILDEGARGLDHWVEKLHREKGRLEKRTEDSSKDVSSLEKAVAQWQELCEQKDLKIEALEQRVKELQTVFEKMQLEVKTKSADLQIQITEERKQYEAKLKQLQQEADYARSTAQGYHSLSEKLQNELVRAAHEPFTVPEIDEASATPCPEDMDMRQADDPSPAPQDAVEAESVAQSVLGEVYSKTAEEGVDYEVLAQQAQFAKTGELLQLEVRRDLEGNTVLHGHELSTNERHRVDLDAELVQELDPEDPWTELFTVVGISLGPPKELVLPTLVGRREVPLAPSGVFVILTVYKYDSRRFFLNGFDPNSQRLVDLVVMEDALPPEACQMIDSVANDEVLFDYFLGRLQLFENPLEGDEAAAAAAEGEEDELKLRLVFNANAAPC